MSGMKEVTVIIDGTGYYFENVERLKKCLDEKCDRMTERKGARNGVEVKTNAYATAYALWEN